MWILVLAALTFWGCNNAAFSDRAGGKNGTSSDSTNGNKTDLVNADKEKGHTDNGDDDDSDPNDESNSQGGSEDDSTGDDIDTGDDTDLVGEDLNIQNDEKNLAKKCKSSAKSLTQALDFPAQSAQCAWNQNSNGPKDGLTPSARSEQVKKINLPSGIKEICSIKFLSTATQVNYDDAMILSLNNLVMASNGFSETRLESQLKKNKGKLYLFDFTDIKHKGYDKNVLQCATGATCFIPNSESQGAFDLDLSSKWFARAKLFEDDIPTSLDVKVIVTGNKQDSDCKHSGVSFEAEIKYIK